MTSTLDQELQRSLLGTDSYAVDAAYGNDGDDDTGDRVFRIIEDVPASEATNHDGNGVPTTRDNRGFRQRRSTERILDRDAAFYQSRGRWRVRHISRSETRFVHTAQGQLRRLGCTKRFWDTWFHTLAYQKTCVLVLILFSLYAGLVFFFAFVYLSVSVLGQRDSIDPFNNATHTELFCEMDIHNHMEALFFSLSTMATIGYGVSDYYFGGCWTPFFLVLSQVCSAILFDAVAIGLLFQRISRGHNRAKTVLFSQKAIIRRVRGIPHLYFRLAELRHHQLLQVSVRAFCVRHERHWIHVDHHQETTAAASTTNTSAVSSNITPTSTIHDTGRIETTHFVTKPLSLLSDSVTFSHVLMSLPQVLVHRMDADSPLMPWNPWFDEDGILHPGLRTLQRQYSEPSQKQGSNTVSVLGHENTNHINDDAFHIRAMEEIQSFLLDREVEIIIILEGTDELTGAVLQTRHSYTYAELAWNARFQPCTFPYHPSVLPSGGAGIIDTSSQRQSASRSTGTWLSPQHLQRSRATQPVCVVDFACFHETLPAPIDADSCPYVGA